MTKGTLDDSTALAELRIAIGRVIAEYQLLALELEQEDPRRADVYRRVAERLKALATRILPAETSGG